MTSYSRSIRDGCNHGESRDYTRMKNMVARHLEQKTREKHFSPGERQLEKPPLALAAANGKF